MDECGDILDEGDEATSSKEPILTLPVDMYSTVPGSNSPTPDHKPLPTTDACSRLGESNTPPQIPRRTLDSHGVSITKPTGGGGGGGGVGEEESVYETPSQPREYATVHVVWNVGVAMKVMALGRGLMSCTIINYK